MSKFRGSLGSKKNNKKEAQKRERQLAKRLGGRATPNSGAMDGDKGDIVLPNFVIDDKFTNDLGYTLETELINKTSREAYERNREPGIIIEFRKMVKAPKEWALIPERLTDLDTFEEINIEGKSHLLSIKNLESYYRRAVKQEKPIAKLVRFHEVCLGVDAFWVLAPLEDIERIFKDGQT